jgi:hypothetical protein
MVLMSLGHACLFASTQAAKNQKFFCKSFFYKNDIEFGACLFACLLPCKLPGKKKRNSKVFLQVIYKVV